MLIRSHEDNAAVAHFAGASPISGEILPVLSRPNGIGGNVDAEFPPDHSSGLDPALPANTRKEREPTMAGKIQGGNLASMAIKQPRMGQPSARPCRRLVVQLGVLLEGRFGVPVGHD